ncbi:FecR family protein [Chryseobacterium sp. ISL-6]|uniref:FecR family protein n=1 Tax=Chryseobacterium sp. ISL-6 TaxID=2819143 RepID=UPI001BEC0A99|nr:FecR family protein [Chryseobacterium sp. ISL-6]MBT2621927.1 FecR domain-containing protein [Chryseobacterium sp. ISL-6]
METDPHIKELFTKYLNNSINREEYVVLLGYFGKEEDQGDLRQFVMEALSVDNSEYDNVELARVVDAVASQLREKLQPRETVRLRRYLPYVAAVLLLISSVTAYYLSRTDQGYLKQKQGLANDVKPGHSAATLTLAGGRKISLNDVSAGTLAVESGITVSKNKNGELIYTISSTNGASEHSINTLSTAKGETYQIVLSDGTKVWLNAGTTLQYAANLREQGKRKVKLAGEAYFEVFKDKSHPFVVETPTQSVEVLGTHFNINSYADEGRTVTTLAEGSVKVSALQNADQKAVILKPGEQSLYSNGDINVRAADMQTALSWKEGQIYFKDASLQEVLRQVSRWYNIEVEYKGEPGSEVFNGGIKRTANLSAVLRILELSNVHFSLNKKNNVTFLTVSPEK